MGGYLRTHEKSAANRNVGRKLATTSTAEQGRAIPSAVTSGPTAASARAYRIYKERRAAARTSAQAHLMPRIAGLPGDLGSFHPIEQQRNDDPLAAVEHHGW